LVSEKIGVDVEAVFRRRDSLTSGWDDTTHLVPIVEKSGTDIVRGVGQIIGEKKVAVENGDERIELEARHAVAICTGSEPIIPNIPGLAEAKPWGPREATSSSIVPKHLIILGGGVVGSEMATAYSSYGAQVTIVHQSTELSPRLDPEVGKLVRESLASPVSQLYFRPASYQCNVRFLEALLRFNCHPVNLLLDLRFSLPQVVEQ
jgi:pyruvate/2-oxoglutarate dehydrogenase complex dihydrolipoamide dehydrogenase (E3) component